MRLNTRMQAGWLLPGFVAHGANLATTNTGIAHGHLAPIAGHYEPVTGGIIKGYLNTLQSRVYKPRRTLRRRLFTQHVPGFQAGMQLQLQTGDINATNARKTKFNKWIKPGLLEVVASFAQVINHQLEIIDDKMPQHEFIMQFCAPAHQRAIMGTTPEHGNQAANQQHLHQPHTLMGWHLKGPELYQTTPPPC